MTDRERAGILFIGDPHLSSRVPGFRKDDYPEAILKKIEWCFELASQENLLSVLLGDFFHVPRDNANWLLARLMEIIPPNTLAIYGNHDCVENQLGADDSLAILVSAERLRLLSIDFPWRGKIAGRPVSIRGSPWGTRIPAKNPEEKLSEELAILITHHDVSFSGYEAGHFTPRAVPGIDLIVNGHIHRTLEWVRKETTLWVNPGNVTRVTRSDASKERKPMVCACIPTIGRELGECLSLREVPHQPFDDVFYEMSVETEDETIEGSSFVSGLKELQARRTQAGAGLHEFLKLNISEFPVEVQGEIWKLAKEVAPDGEKKQE